MRPGAAVGLAAGGSDLQRPGLFVLLLGVLGGLVGVSLGSGSRPEWVGLGTTVLAAALIGLHRPPAARPRPRMTGGGVVLLALLLAAVAAATLNPRTENVSPSDELLGLFLVVVASIIVAPLILGRLRPSRRLLPLILYLALIIVNFVVGRAFDVSLDAWLRQAVVVSALPVFAIGAWRLATMQHVRLLLGVLLAFFAAIACYYASLWSPADELLTLRTELRESFLQTGGTFASALAVTISLPFALRPGRWRRLAGLALLVGLAGVASSFSRTYWFTTPVALVVEVVALRGRELRRGVLLAVLGLAVVAAGVQYSSTAASYEGLVGERLTQPNFSGKFRGEEARGLLHEMASHPTTLLLGKGLGGTFTFYSTDRYAIGGVGTIERDYSHDWYLEVLFATGVTGLLFIVWFMSSIVVGLTRMLREGDVDGGRDPTDRLFAAGLLGTSINLILASFTFHPFGMLLWNIVFGLLFGAACRLVDSARMHPPHLGATVSG